MIVRDDPRLVYVPLEKATTPKDGLCNVYANRFWVYDEERGVVFFRSSKRDPLSPQCNQNERVLLHVRSSMYPWCTIRHIPFVFDKAKISDYL